LKPAVFIVSAAFLASCLAPAGDFEDAGSGIQYKLISFSGGPHIDENSFFLLRCIVCPDGNCSAGGNSFSLCRQSAGPDFWQRFNLGDKVILRIDSTEKEDLRRFSGNSREEPDWPLVVSVEIAALYGGGRYSGEASGEEELMICRENEMINRWLRAGDFSRKNECWISIQKNGRGEKIERGSEVVLSYTTRLSGGMTIDAEGLQADSFSFIYGQPDQLLPGFEAGINELTAGSEAKLIIPSHLAFGKKGSTAGIVPPYEALQFNIKIISVKKRSP
jgi:hypothetical protein